MTVEKNKKRGGRGFHVLVLGNLMKCPNSPLIVLLTNSQPQDINRTIKIRAILFQNTNALIFIFIEKKNKNTSIKRTFFKLLFQKISKTIREKKNYL